MHPSKILCYSQHVTLHVFTNEDEGTHRGRIIWFKNMLPDGAPWVIDYISISAFSWVGTFLLGSPIDVRVCLNACIYMLHIGVYRWRLVWLESTLLHYWSRCSNGCREKLQFCYVETSVDWWSERSCQFMHSLVTFEKELYRERIKSVYLPNVSEIAGFEINGYFENIKNYHMIRSISSHYSVVV